GSARLRSTPCATQPARKRSAFPEHISKGEREATDGLAWPAATRWGITKMRTTRKNEPQMDTDKHRCRALPFVPFFAAHRPCGMLSSVSCAGCRFGRGRSGLEFELHELAVS